MISWERLCWLAGQVTPVEAAARARLQILRRLSRRWHSRVPEPLGSRRVFPALSHGTALKAAFENAGLAKGVLAEAEKVLGGVFTLFGGLEVRTEGGVPNWSAACPEGPPWPAGYSFDIDISGEDGRDVRFTWELSRHGDLCALARAAFLTRGAKYTERLEHLLSDWLEKNPWLCGPNWISALEVAMRAIAWAFIDDACGERFEAGFRSRFIEALYSHGAYLERFLSAGLNPSNHIIGEAAGLFILGGKFEEHEAPRRWRERARRILEKEIIRQTYPSGFSREHSVAYHRFVASLFAVCLASGGLEAFSDAFKSRLAAMYRVLETVMRPDGTFAHIGDSDDAVALRLSPPAPDDLAGDISLAAALFGASAFNSHNTSPEALWLCGPGAAGEETAPGRAAAASVLFPEAGFAVLKDPGSRLRVEFDCGPHGYGRVAAHGHADALSVTLWREGARLVDAGTYRYNGAPAWRNAFRSTAFHNTLALDGLSQAEPVSPFRWLTLANAAPGPNFFSPEADCVSGVLSATAARPWKHRREVIRAADSLVVLLDTVQARGPHTVEAAFHVGAADMEVEPKAVRAKFGGGANMSITALGVSVEFEEAGRSVSPPAGGRPEPVWLSPFYGHKASSRCAVGRNAFEDSCVLPWIFAFGEAQVRVVRLDRGKGAAAEVDSRGVRHLFVSLDEWGLAHIGGLRFAGRWGLFEFEGESLKRAFAADATALEYEGNRLYLDLDGMPLGQIYTAPEVR